MIRIVSLTVIIGGLLWLGLNNISLLRHTAWFIADRFDDRPARKILFLGHSRVYYNDMPDIVRGLANSARVPEKYQITMRALPGASLKTLWNDAKVQRLLEEERWDDIIIQGEGRAHGSAGRLAKFQLYGALLINKVWQRSTRTALIVNWNYAPFVFDNPTPDLIEENDRAMQRDYRELADETGAGLMNSGLAWRIISSAEPSIPLDREDGVHPTLQGSYLSALTVFTCLSGRNDFAATYVPWGMSREQAASLRKAMANSPGNTLLCREPRPLSTAPPASVN